MPSGWLLYHEVFGDEPDSGFAPSATIYHVSLRAFTTHLSLISDSGHRVLSIEEYLAGYDKNSIVITFDDGWRGSFERAMPLLQAVGWKATFFITRDFVGRRSFCDRAMILDAAQAGMDIGVHGTTHRILSGCTREEILEELTACKTYLESLLGKAVLFASLPGGAANDLVVACAKQAGLRCLATSQAGWNSVSPTAYTLKRFGIRRFTKAAEITRFVRFQLHKELVRAALLGIPKRVLGMRVYSHVSRMIHDGSGSRREKLYDI